MSTEESLSLLQQRLIAQLKQCAQLWGMSVSEYCWSRGWSYNDVRQIIRRNPTFTTLARLAKLIDQPIASIVEGLDVK